MKQYKIKVNNEAESEEAQDLFFKLGYEWGTRGEKVAHTEKEMLSTWKDGRIRYGRVDGTGFSFQEITLEELRTLAAPRLYLDPHNGYQECYAVVPQEHWVKVPDSAKQLTKQGENLIFWNGNFQTIDMEHTEWADMGYGANTYLAVRNGSKIVWSIAKNPEELPFIDDGFLMKVDNVNHPNHYNSSSIECIDAMEAMLTPEQFIGYLRGNIFKYQWRYENKNGLEDLRKSQWYLGKLMEKLSEKEA